MVIIDHGEEVIITTTHGIVAMEMVIIMDIQTDTTMDLMMDIMVITTMEEATMEVIMEDMVTIDTDTITTITIGDIMETIVIMVERNTMDQEEV